MAGGCAEEPAGLSNMGRWRKSPLPSNWRALRRVVLKRDRGVCQIKGPRCVVRATEVDHMGAHDDHSLAMLQAACKVCHASKTGRDAAWSRVRPSRARPPEAHPSMIKD